MGRLVSTPPPTPVMALELGPDPKPTQIADALVFVAITSKFP
jgi:hypothetical protein